MTAPKPAAEEEGRFPAGVRVNVTTDEYERLRRIAQEEDRSIASVIRRALREMFEREGNQ